MKPIDYLSKIEPIVITLFQVLVHAERRAAEEHKIWKPMREFHEYHSERFSQSAGDDDERSKSHGKKVAEANQTLLLIHTATAAAAGGVLQIARQCISMVWTEEENRFNKGRLLGSQHLSSVIWHARNQALHFEEGVSKNAGTRQCIDQLHNELGLDNSDLRLRPRSLAKDVIALLGWHSYESFAQDMNALPGSN